MVVQPSTAFVTVAIKCKFEEGEGGAGENEGREKIAIFPLFLKLTREFLFCFLMLPLKRANLSCSESDIALVEIRMHLEKN